MTTKPKAKRFRIRRSSPLTTAASTAAAPDRIATPGNTPDAPSGAARSQVPEGLFDNDDGADGFGDAAFPGSAAAERKAAAPAPDQATEQATEQAAETVATGEVTPGDETAIDRDIAAIRKEGLTGRQLRMARRVAQKYNLAATSDFDAIRLLRAKGIDPFQRAMMLDLVVPEKTAEKPVQLPQTYTRPQLPVADARQVQKESRAEAVAKIQADIARRRRRKSVFLLLRLLFFVGLPTLLSGIYYYAIATPFYTTKSEFVINKAEGAGSSALGGLFSGTGFANSQDSITVQSYLQSREAMLRLNDDIGFKAHFSQSRIDALQRLPEDASNEAAYKLFSKNISIGYDPTEGIIKMEVTAADPAVSAQFSRALIKYAEERVDTLTTRSRDDQMLGAEDSFDTAEAKMIAAQRKVLQLQEQLGVLDPVSESAAVMTQISTFEIQLQQKKLTLDQLLDNARPNQARVEGARGDIRRLQAVVANLRAQLTVGGGTTNSLASIGSELRMAELDLQTRQALMQQALQQLESARIEANRQTRFLAVGVSPIAPDEATSPRKFENTLLAFLIFSGIYLMASLTASVLREQVSA
jgi:capsular polysaccharide transport system permease protein